MTRRANVCVKKIDRSEAIINTIFGRRTGEFANIRVLDAPKINEAETDHPVKKLCTAGIVEIRARRSLVHSGVHCHIEISKYNMY